MTYYKLIFKKDAKKFILENKKIGLKFYQAFSELSKSRTFFSKYDIKKIKGREDIFRLRIGKYRSIFSVNDNKIIIIVFDIMSCGDAYK